MASVTTGAEVRASRGHLCVRLPTPCSATVPALDAEKGAGTRGPKKWLQAASFAKKIKSGTTWLGICVVATGLPDPPCRGLLECARWPLCPVTCQRKWHFPANQLCHVPRVLSPSSWPWLTCSELRARAAAVSSGLGIRRAHPACRRGSKPDHRSSHFSLFLLLSPYLLLLFSLSLSFSF